MAISKTSTSVDVGEAGGSRSTSSSPYISPNELASRWRCSRSTVDRIARRERFTRLCLGIGRNGIVRLLRKEVEEFEHRRCASSDLLA